MKQFSEVLRSSLLGWLRRRSHRLLGVDLGGSAVKVAEIVFQRGMPSLNRFDIAALSSYSLDSQGMVDREMVSEALRQAVARSGAACREAVVALSGRQVSVRELSFPPMTREELKEAIKWDLENYVPYPPENCYYDFTVLGARAEEEETRVLLVAAMKETVDETVGIVKDAGLIPVAVDIEPLALCRTVPDGENSLIIDLGGLFSQIIVFQNGVPVINRSINIGGNRFTEVLMQTLDLEFSEAERLKQRQQGLLQPVAGEGEDSAVHRQLQLLVQELGRETRRTMEYYQVQYKNASVDRVILSGGAAQLGNLASQMALQIDDTPVITHQPFQNLNLNPSFAPEQVRESANQLAVAVGLALYGGEL
ncbi:type iv pilus assembly protein pilm [Lucifera butyrica]|uniref:Type iv pilus assembly protein pilm n=1 Tax=Lucifera butyrica TaxID=1351585 RepID=A0A498R642_9FIRM|nr:type IV pilus assembly protein PilM [Lucifera butyrica]VBB06871.1 type iv pilus assembly protein pilm [Lucifera butyrica]